MATISSAVRRGSIDRDDSTTIDDLVADDHVAYETSWGTLVGRNALKTYAEIARAAFPGLTYHIDGLASGDGVVYCQWNVDEASWIESHGSATGNTPPNRKTMVVRLAGYRIVETWQPCDPWLIARPGTASAAVTRATHDDHGER
ncbi:nuclear transport factor 2 family protein [Natronosalvus vescus]|uniref:nuclear transport factor 2 family protein n=1 Tax=Natronosalvus vescus TaxID=2953881 RepID=UPI0020914E26|nr:nuclear transport factor 2 family protein [Natronosalvus vescus]